MNCTQMRRVLVQHSTMSAQTGEQRDIRNEWETQPCGAPLFSDADKARGTCRSCASGWTHEHNYPVDK